jgi:hypothetical protein
LLFSFVEKNTFLNFEENSTLRWMSRRFLKVLYIACTFKLRTSRKIDASPRALLDCTFASKNNEEALKPNAREYPHVHLLKDNHLFASQNLISTLQGLCLPTGSLIHLKSILKKTISRRSRLNSVCCRLYLNVVYDQLKVQLTVLKSDIRWIRTNPTLSGQVL